MPKMISNDRADSGNLTIGDIADALGVSKSTVSRSISGKGRISEQTRSMVMDYIKEHDYKPNQLAKGLASSKTYNIGWIVPGDSDNDALPFFQRCMAGVEEVAAANDYDILISLVYDNDLSGLKRVINNRKVDGIILGRTLLDDPNVRCLVEGAIPFVVIGSTPEKGVIQIDNDHVAACRELTSILILKGIKKLAFICGSSNHVVNASRLKGYEEGVKAGGIKLDRDNIFLECNTDEDVEKAIEEAIRNKVQCIVCADDHICYNVINKLAKEGIEIPRDIKVASFYNSILLDRNQPSITTLQYDPKELGMTACRTLLDYIDGNPVNEKTMLSYEVMLKGSTL